MRTPKSLLFGAVSIFALTAAAMAQGGQITIPAENSGARWIPISASRAYS